MDLKAVARVAFEAWNTGELSRLDAFVAPDVVHHDPYDPHGREGLEGMKKTIAARRVRYPDFLTTVEDQVADSDRVATRWTATMTHEGRQVTVRGITIDRFENGKIVEAWRCADMLVFFDGHQAAPPR